jgi:L-cysteine:1D-myo-inositol 2-amino-2-deoxy-alpha-D-glucopyranoside ligase
MIGLDGEKMSKSLGNLVFVSKLITQGIAPAAIRWALFSSHYSTDRMWNDSLLAESTQWINRLRTALSRVDVAPTQVIISEILTCLSNNLDTATALLLIQQWVVETERGATGGEAGELSRALDTILGITL